MQRMRGEEKRKILWSRNLIRLFLKYVGTYLLDVLVLKVQRLNTMKGSIEQDSRQSEMLWESQEKKSLYIRRIINLGVGLMETELGPRMKTLWSSAFDKWPWILKKAFDLNNGLKQEHYGASTVNEYT